MSEILKRREFVSRMWKAGLGLVGIAGAWTGWELLQPLASAGFGGKVRTLPPESVPETGVVEIPAARAYLARINDEIVAISEKCTHLGCRVPYCDSSGQFECPCHGTVFNRAGDYRAGPAPRGMDRYPVEVGEDGMIYVDTSVKISGPAPGGEQINEPQSGPMCSGGGH